MMNNIKTWQGAFLLFILFILFAATVVATAMLPVSKELLPDSIPSVNSAHVIHKQNKIDCVVCHAKAKTSQWASHKLIPQMKRCGQCHKEVNGVNSLTKNDKQCSKCHLFANEKQQITRGEYPRPNIRFSHKAHETQQCSNCHLADQSINGFAKLSSISMKLCFDCHSKKEKASVKCQTCHLVYKDGKMVTTFGETQLKPPTFLKGNTHGQQWIGTHAQIAGSDSAFCASCHRETFCQDCHTGRLRPRKVHPGDWLAIHGVSSRIDNPQCQGCHRSQSFCLNCHRRAGVAPDSAFNTNQHGSGNYHKNSNVDKICKQARYNITACVSCHSESSCIRCHSAINPHPAGFSNKCKPLAQKNKQACKKCHSTNIWNLCK